MELIPRLEINGVKRRSFARPKEAIGEWWSTCLGRQLIQILETMMVKAHYLRRQHRINQQWVALLLEHMDIENEIAAGDPEAYTVLTSAAAFGHKSVVKQLLEKGVDPDSKGAMWSEWHGAVDLCPEDDDDLPPHILAAGNNHKDIVALLLDRGVDVNMSHPSSGHTALSKAAEEYADCVVQLLLERGADPNHQMSDGRTPFALAVLGGNVSLVKALLDAGADPDSEINWMGYGEYESWTPLQFAAISSRNEAGAIV
ncbi:hypothetical protein CNMCM5793_005513 [Aspergillus hiratsukae]|uniref:Ankyrin repeat-containing domain protein n=1 Tax=Aspergillus hiratsukae TaxID=1194566 RepID=A0A8H6QGR6_9EURO|nr:hypothetical protein CNMCM5793_005513 [Aspergillus hiratsukae]KAF7171651.1 hypothetical protein CNMCM6106_006051 [Aspergillus hiratsukae]